MDSHQSEVQIKNIPIYLKYSKILGVTMHCHANQNWPVFLHHLGRISEQIKNVQASPVFEKCPVVVEMSCKHRAVIMSMAVFRISLDQRLRAQG